MKSWKIRLGLMLTMLAMLLAVAVPASAQTLYAQYPPGDCWVDEWGYTWCPWDPSLVAPAAAPVVETVEQVDEDEDDFATLESDLDDLEDLFGDLEDIEEDFCDEDDDDCDDGDFVNALDDDDDCDDDDDGDCDDDDDDDDEFDFSFVDDEEEFEELFE